MINLLGKVLSIDLSNGTTTIESFDEQVALRYLGGRGLNAWELRRSTSPEIDPFSPENPLLLSCGLLTGTPVPASSRLQLAARSPQTNLMGSSNVGGHFGAAMRHAGYNMIRITGRASTPSMIWIDGDHIEIREAPHLWGLDNRSTASSILGQNGSSKLEILSIGTGGENRVRYASIATGDGHAAGRTGLGAVMGSKCLKAIVIVRKPVRSNLDPGVKAILQDYAMNMRNSERYDLYSTHSNAAYFVEDNDLGIIGTRNFQTSQFESADKIDGYKLVNYVEKYKSCHRCPIHCRAQVQVENGRFGPFTGERTDIEGVMAFGPRIGVDSLDAVLYMFHLVNELGIDAISTAGVLAFAIELYEKGILTTEDTGGLELRWGDPDPLITLIEQIGRREAFGDVLADGVRIAAERIGRGAEHYAYHSKGLELPGYDPRGAQGTALSYAISSRGADYASVYPSLEYFWTPEQGKEAFGTEKSVDRFSPEGKGKLVWHASLVSAILDSLGLCKMAALSVIADFSLEREARLLSALSGWDMTTEDLFTIGQQIITEERRLNITYGMTQSDDDLPAKFFEDPIPSGHTKGQTVQLSEMLRDYYAAMGWDIHGNPPDEPAL